MGRSPKQILFEETIDVFLTETESILYWDLVRGNILIKGDKPTDTRIPFGSLGTLTLHPNDLDGELAVLTCQCKPPKRLIRMGRPLRSNC